MSGIRAIDEDIIVGNTSAHRWTCRATCTEQSPLLPVPPTGKPATVLGSHIVHRATDKAVEVWHFGDWLGWLQQNGRPPTAGVGRGVSPQISVLTFGNEYAKMQSTHLGFIVPVLFLLICLPSRLMSIIVDITLSGVIYLAECRLLLMSPNGERSDPRSGHTT
jgi:hypothetical protein